jgi:hypothetical protein
MASKEHPDMSGNPCDEPIVCDQCDDPCDESNLYGCLFDENKNFCTPECVHEYQQLVLELNATREEVFRLSAEIENESSEGMRMFRKLESRMQQEIRRAEEDGYARGLRDAQKHPEELGLCRLSLQVSAD